MADILDEVESDYRADQLRAIAARYVWVAVALLVAALAATAAWQYWQSRAAKAREAAATTYLAAATAADALVPGDTAGHVALAHRLAGQVSTAPGGYRALYRLREAALLADAGQLAQAQAIWDQVSTDPGADVLLRQLASLLWVERGLESADPAALRTRLVSLTTADNAYHALAQEAQAMLDLRLDQTDAARALLRRLSADPATPDGVRNRAGALLSRLGG